MKAGDIVTLKDFNLLTSTSMLSRETISKHFLHEKSKCIVHNVWDYGDNSSRVELRGWFGSFIVPFAAIDTVQAGEPVKKEHPCDNCIHSSIHNGGKACKGPKYFDICPVREVGIKEPLKDNKQDSEKENPCDTCVIDPSYCPGCAKKNPCYNCNLSLSDCPDCEHFKELPRKVAEDKILKENIEYWKKKGGYLTVIPKPKEYIPFQKCPICLGTGSVMPGFYTPFATSIASSETCRTCGGSGIIPMAEKKGE